MKLYQPSIFTSVLDRVSLTFTGSTLAETAVDNDRYTLVRTTSVNPDFTVTFGAGGAQSASSVWVRTVGYTAVEVLADGVSLGSFPMDSDGFAYGEFTETDALVWVLRFTGTGGIWEAYLQRKVLDLDAVSQRPIQWRIARIPGIFYRSAAGDLLQFRPFGFGGGAATISLGWELLDNDSVAALFRAWMSSLADNREVGLYPVPAFRPHHFFQARWLSEFDFSYSGRKIADGQSGSALFQEVDVRL